MDNHKKILNDELEQFNSILSEVLPRYIHLSKKKDTSPEEEKELSDMEQLLIEVNAKIAEIKSKMDQDLFGESMNEYYKAKDAAINGDALAQERLEKLREAFLSSVRGEGFYHWN